MFRRIMTRLLPRGDVMSRRSSSSFTSDNCRGVLPEVMTAVVAANAAPAVPSYGTCEMTARAQQSVRLFLGCGEEAEVLLTVSGIASDALALTPLAAPTRAIFCHTLSHVNLWQCGAVGFYTGAMVEAIDGDHGKIDPAQLRSRLASACLNASYQPWPAVVSVTQPTEAGTLYTLAELREICDIAHDHGVQVHMDGARLGNAAVALNCEPAAVTWEAGVDALSLGTTKGGTLAAEAIVFFDPSVDLAVVRRQRKRAGHELSKMRFVAAQVEAFLGGGLWRRSAEHANKSASQLGKALFATPMAEKLGLRWQHACETNQLFLSLPDNAAGSAAADRLCTAVGGVRWDSTEAGRICVRLVTAFDTEKAEMDAAVSALAAAGGRM